MLIGIAYLALFLAAGLLLARWAVPDGSPAVAVPLGCGFGVSLLAALPAGFALVCGFTLRAVWLAAAGAALLCAVLILPGADISVLLGTPTVARCGSACCRCWP